MRDVDQCCVGGDGGWDARRGKMWQLVVLPCMPCSGRQAPRCGPPQTTTTKRVSARCNLIFEGRLPLGTARCFQRPRCLIGSQCAVDIHPYSQAACTLCDFLRHSHVAAGPVDCCGAGRGRGPRRTLNASIQWLRPGRLAGLTPCARVWKR
eukprot:351801-Chlamydomonas_euryale.AAC.15